MSMRNPAPSRRSLRPLAESLETRQLLSSLSTHPSASVTGTDAHGDVWTLTLFGPGTLNVVDQQGTAFPAANGHDINTITVSGTVTSESRLVGKLVKEGTGPDAGKVFFQQLTINNTGAYGQLNPALVHPRASTPQNGIAAVDMPAFWLGDTSGLTPTTTPPLNFPTSNFHTSPLFHLAGGINAPEGINTLRFGGVDTTFTPASGTALDQTGQNNEFVINLGPPIAGGTSIIVNQVKTDAVPSTTSGSPANQQSVTFLVAGRINLFQANEIDGSTGTGSNGSSLAPTQFPILPETQPQQPQSPLLPGGTYLVSDVLAGSALTTGQIGDIRIGGPATNFTAFALETDTFTPPPSVDPVTGPQVSNFFIGGKTDNVILVAPSGSRNVFFGQGMDNVYINTEFIQNLQANQGASGSAAMDSAVTVKRNIGNLVMGGDVINTVIQSGYDQNLSAVANLPASSVPVVPSPAGVFNGEAPPTIINRISNAAFNQTNFSPLAHGGGEIHGRIAGNVTNSIISVSVDPNPFLPNPSEPPGSSTPGQFQNVTSKTFPFGAPNNIVLPRGVLSLKFHGTVDNREIQVPVPSGTTNPLGLSGPAVAQTNSAFFAKYVRVEPGRVVPPHVPVAPYPSPTPYHIGQRFLKGLFKRDNSGSSS